MQKKSIYACLQAVLILIGIWCGCQAYSRFRYAREIIVTGPDTPNLAIYIEPDEPATRAAANYLAYAAEQALGTKAEIVTEQGEAFRGVRILCGTEAAEETQKAKIEFITTAEAADDEAPAYSVRLEGQAVSILVPERENCFGAVKAVVDRWLQEDCGRTRSGELRVSRAIIGQQLSGLPTAVEGTFRILSQNLCYSDDGEGRSVEERAERFFKLVEEYQPDLIGTQECSWQWLKLLQAKLGDRYGIYGGSRKGPDYPEYERDVILFRKDRFALKDGETFWLSNTPSEPDTKLNYDGPCRICTWGLLQDSETEKTLLFSNTHLNQYRNEYYQEVRARQAEILFRHLRKGEDRLSHYPGLLTGDFNGKPDEPFYAQVTAYYADAGTAAITDRSTVDYSFHDYGQEQSLYDYCFFSPGKITALEYRILNDEYDGYVSDHYGILVTAVAN